MSNIKFSDTEVEATYLSECLKGPEYFKQIPESWLTEDINKKCYQELKKFLGPPYNTYPSIDVIFEKVEDLDVKLRLKEISSIKISRREVNVKIYDLFEMYATRRVYDVASTIPNALEQTRVEEVVRAKIRELSELVNPFEAGLRTRGFIHESAPARWDRYRKIEANPNDASRLPFGIFELDKATGGGIKKGHIALFFGISGGYKTRVKANVAYNSAFLEKKDVMVITLEVPKEDYEMIIDSRHTLLDFTSINNGALGEARSSYRKSLVDMSRIKPSLYLVDIPGSATSLDITLEAELYYSKFGKYPDEIVLDYINEMEPIGPWKSTSEKFKNMGTEIRRGCRSYNYGFVSSMQENKEGKKIKEREKVGTEHIGESFNFQNVCHLIVHLFQDAEGIDESMNQLNMSIKKNRYGPKNITFAVFASGVYNYVGDRKLILPSSI